MISNSQDNDYLIFNPDTLWQKVYVEEIDKMQKKIRTSLWNSRNQ